MNKRTRLIAISGGSVLAVVLVVLSFFMMVASPLVLGSNVDPVTKQIAYNAPIRISFSGPMNHDKTEAAFQLEPKVDGKLSWDGNTLVFTPKEKFRIGDHYTVTVDTTAESLFGKKLQSDYLAEFIIAGAPEVIYTAPQDIVVGKDAKVVVMFNQPMVDLTSLDNNKADNIKFSMTPQTDGTIKWIDTSSFEFVPKDHLVYASKYSVTVAAGSAAADGGQTEKDFSFNFSTIAPQVVSFEPENGYDLAGPTTPLKIHFNQPIDLKSLESNLTVTPATKFSFAYDPKDANTVVLQPEGGLKFTTDYTLVLGKNTKGTEGKFTLTEDQKWQFKTVGALTLSSSDPKEGAKDANEYSVNLYFSNPLDRASFQDKVSISPTVENLQVSTDSYSDDETTLYITGDMQYDTAYTLTVKPGGKDKYGQTLDQPVTLHFTTKDRDPYLKIARKDYYNLFNAYQKPVYPIKTINLDSVDAYFCALSLNDFLTYTYGYDSTDPTTCLQKKSWQVSTKGEKNKIQSNFVDFAEVLGKPLTPGIYYLRISSDKITDEWSQKDYVTFFTSKTALTMKVDKEKAVVWATDLASGLPVSDMTISLVGDDGKEIASGKTTKDGLYQTPMNYQGGLFAVGKKGDDLSVLSRYWANGISYFDFGYSSDWHDNSLFSYLYTDRPIYRPEQKVFFKGILRVDNDAKFALPQLKNISVKISDPDGKEIYNEKLPVSKLGTFNGEVLLDKGASLGAYQLYVDVGDNSFYQDFYVEEYRKPEFKVGIVPEKRNYTEGETLKATVAGSYYFGGALKGKPVTWTINRSDYYFSDYQGEWYSFTDSDGFWYCYESCKQSESFVTSGEGTLDDQGNFQISTPLSLKDQKLNQVYIVEATIQDDSNQTVSNRIPVYVYKGNYVLGIKSSGYSYAKGDQGTFNVVLLDLDQKPVQNRNVSVSLYQRVWNQVQKKNIDGEFYTDYEPKDTFVKKVDVSTDSSGKASGNFTFDQGGEMLLKATVKDDKGRDITSSTSVYVSDNTYISWFSGDNNRIDLIPDKQEYNLGDTAKILIKSPFSNVKALVTYERRNIFEKKVIDLTSNSEILEVPITEAFVPNTYISVVLMKGGGISKAGVQSQLDAVNKQLADLSNQPDMDPTALASQQQDLQNRKKSLENMLSQATDKVDKPDFRVGYTNLHVDNASKKITVEISPDKERYTPGSTVNLALKTTNSQNQAVPAEISVAVVDESVLALKVKDENIVDIFYGKKDLGVDTSSSMSIFTDTVDVKTGRAKGGGGGETTQDRTNFKDTAYFKASVQTGADGTGSVSFQLPDNLTTWRVIAVAVNQDTLVGSNTKSFLATKDLILRPVLPRFFRYGDEVEVSAIIQNGQAKDDNVKVSLSADQVVQIESNKEVSLNVKKDNSEKATWKVKIGSGTSTTLTLKAQGGSAADSVEMSLPILPYATPEVVATFGETDTSRTEKIRLPDSVSKDMGNVAITVYSSLLTNIAKGLDSLIRYPYGCAEQTMSALVSTISSKNILEKFGKSLPDIQIEKDSLFDNEKLLAEKDPKKKIELMMQIGLQKVYSFQRSDGGWGYWAESTQSYAHLSSYILFGLNELKKSGYSVDANVVQRGLDYLKNYIGQHNLKAMEWQKGKWVEVDRIDPFKANERAFALYVLANLGKGDLGLTNNLYEIRSSLNFYAQAYLAGTLHALKQNDKANTVIKELLAVVNQDNAARTAHLEEKEQDYYGMNTDMRSTALLVQALLQVDPKNVMLPRLIRYLAHNENTARYINTQEIASTLFAFRDYLDMNGLDKQGTNFKVSLNGENILNGKVDPDQNPQMSVMKDIANFVGATNEFVVQSQDQGKTIYYDLVAKYFLPILQIAPRNNGLTVKREYYAFADKEGTKPLNNAKVGDILRAKLTIVVPKTRDLVVVESHLPAGFEAVNFNLDTTQQGLQDNLNTTDKDIWGDAYWTSGLWHFNHIEMRDDRVALFADSLPAGVYEYEYAVQVTSAGTFANPPALGYEMYFPEIFGRSRGEVFTVSQ